MQALYQHKIKNGLKNSNDHKVWNGWLAAGPHRTPGLINTKTDSQDVAAVQASEAGPHKQFLVFTSRLLIKI